MIIQRYSVGLWPSIKGEIPFIVTGPNFCQCTWGRRLPPYERIGKAFAERLYEAAVEISSLSWDDAMPIIAELLLREGHVTAIWSSATGACLPEGERWRAAISGLVEETPVRYFDRDDVVADVLELLDGMTTRQHYVSLFLVDDVMLEETSVPNDNVV